MKTRNKAGVNDTAETNGHRTESKGKRGGKHAEKGLGRWGPLNQPTDRSAHGADEPVFGIVERFAGDLAVIEIGGSTRNVPRSLVAEDVNVNDVVEWIDGKWVRNERATKERAARIKRLMDSLWED